MNRYVVLLRAINVGGSKIIKMEELRKIMVMPGLKNIETYIQSGNVIFDAAENDKSALREKIEKRLHKSLGYEVETFVRSAADMKNVVKNNPFGDIRADKTIQLYIAFLEREAEKEMQDALLVLENKIDSFHFAGSELYWLCRKGLGESKMAGSVIEKKLKQKTTLRNWATTKTLLEKYLPAGS
ncbi:MAG: hypothetical protein FD123_3321 [Bacteroidetes bacterium]|nr:MAG: hypothetical protein FD123_3321 [Bacteroidota bacterium]